MNKNQRYESNSNHCDSLSADMVYPISGEAETEKEERLREILSQTNGETLIGISIRERLSSGDIRGFREMIKELKQQYNDCGRERMIEVFGIDAVRLIEVL